jgi:DHA3 family macrolide efflux protein-like MFS transporter
MSIISAPLGALFLALLPMQAILAIDVFTAMLAIIPLFFFQVPQPARNDLHPDANGKSTFKQDFMAGLSYVWGWPGLMLIGVMAAVINFLLTPAFTLLPILVTKHFSGQAIQLATLESFYGIGVIVGGLTLSVWGGFKRRIMTSLVGLVAMGVGCLVMGLLPPTAFVIAVAVGLFLGFINPIVNGPLLAAVQAAVTPEMQGRVFSLIGTVAAAMSPLGLIIAGPIADNLGVQTWFMIGGIVTLLMGITSLFIPAIMNFEHGRTPVIPAVAQKPVLSDLDLAEEQVVKTSKPNPIEVDCT